MQPNLLLILHIHYRPQTSGSAFVFSRRSSPVSTSRLTSILVLWRSKRRHLWRKISLRSSEVLVMPPCSASSCAGALIFSYPGSSRKILTVLSLYRSTPLTDFAVAGLPLTSADFALALDAARSSYSESIGAPKIPNVSWDDVGGLASVKREILDTVELPLMKPELFASGLKKRSGEFGL